MFQGLQDWFKKRMEQVQTPQQGRMVTPFQMQQPRQPVLPIERTNQTIRQTQDLFGLPQNPMQGEVQSPQPQLPGGNEYMLPYQQTSAEIRRFQDLFGGL